MENKTIEEIIAETIREKGLLQKYVCQKTNISQTNLSLSLRGKRLFKSNEFVSLCALLGLNFENFAGCISE